MWILTTYVLRDAIMKDAKVSDMFERHGYGTGDPDLWCNVLREGDNPLLAGRVAVTTY